MSTPTIRSSKTPIALAIATAASMTAMQAIAQEQEANADAEEKSSLALEEITVTATKRESSLQDLAQSAQAFGADQIEKLNFQNFGDYVNAIPSVASVAVNPGQNEIVFRGISTGTAEWRTDSSTAVYLDEVPMTLAASQVDPRMVDIERVEALPGPQGTLFGSSSQSGAMRIITKKADTSVTSGWVEVSGSTVAEGSESYSIEGAVNIPIVEDKFAIRLVGYDVHEGGFIDNVRGNANIFKNGLWEDNPDPTNPKYYYDTSFLANVTNDDVVEKDFNTWDQTGFRVNAIWNINDDWTADFMYMKQTAMSRGDWKEDPLVGEYEIVRFYKDWREDDWFTAALTLTGDLGFAELTIAASHLDRTVDYVLDNSTDTLLKSYGAKAGWNQFSEYDYYLGTYDASYYTLQTAYDFDFNLGTIHNDQVARRNSLEVRLASQGDSKFQWMVGGYYEESYDYWNWWYNMENLENLTAWQGTNYYDWWGSMAYLAWWQSYAGYDVDYPVMPTEKYYDTYFYRDTTQKAVFGEFSYDITDKLSVLAGLRWFGYERKRDEWQFWPERVPYGNYETGGLDAYDGKDDDMVKKFSVTYQITDDAMIYGTYSEGFRLGGNNSLRKQSVLPKQYASDKLFNHEIGIKSMWLDGRLEVNSTFFYMEWENMQRSVGDPAGWWDWTMWGVSAHVNVGDAYSQGNETSFRFQATENISLDGSFFISEARMSDDAPYADAPLQWDKINARGPAGSDALGGWDYNTDMLAVKGQKLAIAPDAKWYLGVNYEVPEVMSGIDLWFRYDHAWEDSRSHDWWNAQRGIELIPEQEWANFRMGLIKQEDWSVTFSIQNVWDERSVAWVDTWQDGQISDYPTNGRYMTLNSRKRPREFQLRFKKEFN